MGGFWAWGMHGIDLFFVISGFIMAQVHWQDFKQGTGWRRFLVSRVSRIYAPYWPVLAVLVIAYFVMPAVGSESGRAVRDTTTIIRSALLLPATDGVVPVAWTLEHEIVFYSIVLVALIRPFIGVMVFMGWQLHALTAGHVGTVTSDHAKFFMGPYEIEFAFGIACMLILRTFPTTRYPRLILVAGTSLFFAIALYSTYIHDFIPVSFSSTVSYGIASSIVLLGAIYCEQTGHLRIPKLAVFLGGASYSIYLVHYPCISLFSKALGRFGLTAPQLVDVGMIGLSATAIIAGCAYHMVAERPLTAISRAWLARALALRSVSPGTHVAIVADLGSGDTPQMHPVR